MAAVFAVELRHEGLVGIPDHENPGVKGFDLFLAALMGLDADSPATPPVISLPLKSYGNNVMPQRMCTVRHLQTLSL